MAKIQISMTVKEKEVFLAEAAEQGFSVSGWAKHLMQLGRSSVAETDAVVRDARTPSERQSAMDPAAVTTTRFQADLPEDAFEHRNPDKPYGLPTMSQEQFEEALATLRRELVQANLVPRGTDEITIQILEVIDQKEIEGRLARLERATNLRNLDDSPNDMYVHYGKPGSER